MSKGTWHAFFAYLMWGFFPVYWKLIQVAPAPQILAHRIFWSFILLSGVITIRKDWDVIRKAASNRRSLLAFFIASCLLAVNWLTYIWGVNAGYVIETSLGYFINPLVSVLLGMVFLREKLRPLQWLPVSLAAAGVLYLTFSYGKLPWIALVLAVTFGLYGLAKKIAPLGSLHGLTLETSLLALPALGYLLFAEASGAGALGHTGWTTGILLVLTGVITAIPLLLFGSAARLIPLTTIGLMQYIAPTCQFLLGVLVYNETFSQQSLIGFSLIWIALAIFWIENYRAYRQSARLHPKIAASH